MVMRYGMKFEHGTLGEVRVDQRSGYSYMRQGAKNWRWLAPDSDGAAIGPQYASREALLASAHPYEAGT